jgi:hypothetical protein
MQTMFPALFLAVHISAACPAITSVANMAPEEFLGVDCNRAHDPSMCQMVQVILHALTRHPGQPIDVRIGKCARAIAGVPDVANDGMRYADAADACQKVADAFDLR